MAFTIETIDQTASRKIHSLVDTGSTVAQISAAGYLASLVPTESGLKNPYSDGDLVICTGSDGTALRIITNADDAGTIQLVALTA